MAGRHSALLDSRLGAPAGPQRGSSSALIQSRTLECHINLRRAALREFPVDSIGTISLSGIFSPLFLSRPPGFSLLLCPFPPCCTQLARQLAQMISAVTAAGAPARGSLPTPVEAQVSTPTGPPRALQPPQPPQPRRPTWTAGRWPRWGPRPLARPGRGSRGGRVQNWVSVSVLLSHGREVAQRGVPRSAAQCRALLL